jgi:hypothetical protein
MMFTTYPRRTVLGFSLFIGQAFLYNAITFGYAQILATFFGVKTNPGYYFAVIAVGNLLLDGRQKPRSVQKKDLHPERTAVSIFLTRRPRLAARSAAGWRGRPGRPSGSAPSRWP